MSELLDEFTKQKIFENVLNEVGKVNIKAPVQNTTQSDRQEGKLKVSIGILVDLQKYSTRNEILSVARSTARVINQLNPLISSVSFTENIKKLINTTLKPSLDIRIFAINQSKALYQMMPMLDYSTEVIGALDPNNIYTTKALSDMATSYLKVIDPEDITVNLVRTTTRTTGDISATLFYSTITDDAHKLLTTPFPYNCTSYILNDPKIDQRANSSAARNLCSMIRSKCLADLNIIQRSSHTSEIIEVNKKFEELAGIIKAEQESAENDSRIIKDKQIDITVRNNVKALDALISRSTENNSAISSQARAQIKDLNKEFQDKHPFLSGKYFSLDKGINWDVIKVDLKKTAENEKEAMSKAWIAMFPGAQAPFAELVRDDAERKQKELEIRRKDQADAFKYVKCPHYAELYKSFTGEELHL